jgi:membrane protein implicated in regulation of membrane protease activity
MDEPESWRWIRVVAALVFGLGEMSTPGSFFLAPFGVGALVAAVLAFAGVSVGLEWLAFVGVSVACLFALRPLAHRLDRELTPHGIGSRRLIGRDGVVLEAIPAGDLGVVRVDREEWRAVTTDRAPLEVGTAITVIEVEGTKVVVVSKEPA